MAPTRLASVAAIRIVTYNQVMTMMYTAAGLLTGRTDSIGLAN
jgi:hypothetical protein